MEGNIAVAESISSECGPCAGDRWPLFDGVDHRSLATKIRYGVDHSSCTASDRSGWAPLHVQHRPLAVRPHRKATKDATATATGLSRRTETARGGRGRRGLAGEAPRRPEVVSQNAWLAREGRP